MVIVMYDIIQTIKRLQSPLSAFGCRIHIDLNGDQELIIVKIGQDATGNQVQVIAEGMIEYAVDSNLDCRIFKHDGYKIILSPSKEV